jgi:hypothetical protein
VLLSGSLGSEAGADAANAGVGGAVTGAEAVGSGLGVVRSLALAEVLLLSGRGPSDS